MPGTIFNMDAANLFVGDDDPSNSQFLVLKNVKLPTLTEKTKTHSPAGAVGDVELGLRSLEPIQVEFSLEGFNPDVISYFMAPQRVPYTIRGNIKDVRTHEDIPLLAVVRGRMAEWDPTAFEKDNGMESNYRIHEILFYELYFGGEEKVFYDWQVGPMGARMNGVPIFADVARNLGLS